MAAANSSETLNSIPSLVIFLNSNPEKNKVSQFRTLNTDTLCQDWNQGIIECIKMSNMYEL